MIPRSSSSRDPSGEFERIPLEDLSRETTPQPGPSRPELRIIPPSDTDSHPPQAGPSTSLSPSRPIILPRVSLRRANTGNAPSAHWRRPSYARVDSSVTTQQDQPEPARQYDVDGGVEPDIHEVQDGLNVALGTGTALGSWLPITRQPSARKIEQISPVAVVTNDATTAPQIVVEDTGAGEAYETDERETAGLTGNAVPIAGAAPVRRAMTLGSIRPQISTAERLGSDLSAAERGAASVDVTSSSMERTSAEMERPPVSAGNAVIRHIRKASRRVVDLANAGDSLDTATEFPFPGGTPQPRVSTDEVQGEFPFPDPDAPITPVEKPIAEFGVTETREPLILETVNFRGKSLGIFGPNNPIRNWLCNLLLHPATEPVILLVIIAQTVFLIIQSAPNFNTDPTFLNWGSWVDYCLLGVFVFYTLESIARIIVAGLIFNPPTPLEKYHRDIGPRPSATILQPRSGSRSRSRSRSRSPTSPMGRNDSLRRQYSTSAIHRTTRHSSSHTRKPSTGLTTDLRRQPSTLQTLSPDTAQRGRQPAQRSLEPLPAPAQVQFDIDQDDYPIPLFSAATFQRTGEEDAKRHRNLHKHRLARRAYLRHSFNRMDFIAVVSFWISLALELSGIFEQHHIYVFRMLSCLRIFRLLGLSEGMATILRSLKKAAPLLVQVAFFVGFFWVIFAIVGIQTFRGSLRRQCVWIDPTDSSNNYTQMFQFCGGYLDPIDLSPQPYITANGTPTTEAPKGYLCPVQSICMENNNPYNGTVSFDNFAQSMELVFVIISTNTFTDLMYYAIDAEHEVASLFFVIGIIVLTFWLVNLVIAVITSSFQVTREESQQSAFTSKRQETWNEEVEKLKAKRHITRGQQWYNRTRIFWLALIIADLIIQALRTSTMGPSKANFLSVTESIVTIIFDFEILLRFAVSFPDWRTFFYYKSNCFDLFLAVATSIIQIPAIHNSSVYGWLTIFQILRVYRVIMAVPFTRDLLTKVLGNVYGILNLIMFLFMMTFLCGILACQLVRGDIPTYDQYGNMYEMSFRTVWNGFLGMYQILSSENWTQILYAATEFQTQYHIAWISATFFILWFIIGNNVVLSMFIAVIQENIGVTEEDKRKEQVQAFIEKAVPTLAKTDIHGNLTMASVFRKKKKKPLFDTGPEAFNLLLKEAVVREFLDEQVGNRPPRTLQEQREQQLREQNSWMGRLRRFWTGDSVQSTLGRTFNLYTRQDFRASITASSLNPDQMAQDAVLAHAKQRAQEADFLRQNPKANKSLWIFSASNPIRHYCQLLVAPSRGERPEGTNPNPLAWWIFSAFTYTAIVCIVVLACITTPLYQLEYFATNGEQKFNWITWSDIAFAIIFSVEAIIKIIADGFLLTPNAYLRNVWNDIDFFVLITLWINVVADLTDRGGLSRAFRAFKALRALRLVNISDTARQTFHDVIISGMWNIISAAFVAISLLIPYAIWGLNIFNGLMYSCNDLYTATNKTNCIGEYNSSPQNWNVWAPRSFANPQFYNFDDFASSLVILFEIVSQEGWINVLTSAMAIVGIDQNPRIDASPLNAIFFVSFNILGAVFVLTLFVSVIITNYTKRSGIAYMTADQRAWQELRKVLLQLRPSRRPPERPEQSWKAWCYDRAISKHGFWTRFMTAVYTLHIILLCCEIYPSPAAYTLAQNYAFLALSLIYVANIVIRMVGLGTYHYFRSLWDVYDLVIVTGTITTTVIMLANVQNNIFLQFQKLFLVGIAFNLIRKNDALDQLFKTAASSLPTIASLLFIWLVLFMVYAIAMTQIFGLTRIGPNGTGTLNFRTIPNALIVLFRMSLGEGWNQIMIDYTVTAPQCISDPNFFKTDCGDPAWAYGLFISWNILSMYIFANMLLTVVYENFSYVYQRAGKLRLFSRDETRRFKKTWAIFDKYGSGYLRKDQIAPFLSRLQGIFEVRIYDEYHSIPTILQQCRDHDPMKVNHNDPYDISNIDLHLLRNAVDRLPVHEIRERRHNFNILYEEAMVSADERGISFTQMLLMLAHYKFIDDNKALSLDEFLRRRAKLVRVTDQVNQNIVRGFFLTLFQRRAFLAQRASSGSSFTGMVPSIVVEESESEILDIPRAPMPSMDLTQMRTDMGTGYYSNYSPTSPAFDGQDQLHVSSSGAQSDNEDDSPSAPRTWTTIGADSNLTASSGVQLSQPVDENEAAQIAHSLTQSPWAGELRSQKSDRSAGSHHGE